MATSYDLNDIADAITAKVQGVDTSADFDGQDVLVTADSEVTGAANVPAVVIEFDDIVYDETMARGADAFVFLAHVLVSVADSPAGQRLLRTVLSSGGAVNRIKDALNGPAADQTLGGLVSYAHVPGTRAVGKITYGAVDYLGATLEIQVLSR